MKKILFIASLVLCGYGGFAQNKQDLSFQAEIANRNGDTIRILNGNTGMEARKIAINSKGLFKDVFAIEDGVYVLYDGKEYTRLFLKNGFDLKLKIDAQKFDESIVFTGKGENENNYLAQYAISESKYDYNGLIESDEVAFNKGLESKKAADLAAIDKAKLDPAFTILQKKNIQESSEGLTQYYKKKLEGNKLNNSLSASFDYENHKGGKTKLEDFKGKYVYIDVWATWCGPCIREIPSLKKVEEKYHGKNIEFVSISIDDDKDHEKWKTFVTEKQLGGVQLFADKNWNSDFVKFYGITGIPRFILIDPTGKIVKADAARPSDPALQVQLDKLLN